MIIETEGDSTQIFEAILPASISPLLRQTEENCLISEQLLQKSQLLRSQLGESLSAYQTRDWTQISDEDLSLGRPLGQDETDPVGEFMPSTPLRMSDISQSAFSSPSLFDYSLSILQQRTRDTPLPQSVEFSSSFLPSESFSSPAPPELQPLKNLVQQQISSRPSDSPARDFAPSSFPQSPLLSSFIPRSGLTLKQGSGTPLEATRKLGNPRPFAARPKISTPLAPNIHSTLPPTSVPTPPSLRHPLHPAGTQPVSTAIIQPQEVFGTVPHVEHSLHIEIPHQECAAEEHRETPDLLTLPNPFSKLPPTLQPTSPRPPSIKPSRLPTHSESMAPTRQPRGFPTSARTLVPQSPAKLQAPSPRKEIPSKIPSTFRPRTVQAKPVPKAPAPQRPTSLSQLPQPQQKPFRSRIQPPKFVTKNKN